MSWIIMPSSTSPLLDFTTPLAPPSATPFSFCARAGETMRVVQSTSAVVKISRSIVFPMAFSCSAAAVTVIGRRAIRIPTTFLPQIAHEVVDIRLLQGVFVGGHTWPALANFLLHRVVVDGLAGKQGRTLEQPGELRDVLGEFVVAKPTFVIKNFLTALRSARGGFLELVDLQG